MNASLFMEASSFMALIPLIVGADMIAYPGLQGDALQGQVEGDVRHAIRVTLGEAGFLVDLLWNEPQVKNLLGLAISNEIRRAQVQRGTETPLPPASTLLSIPAGSITSLPYVTFVDKPS